MAKNSLVKQINEYMPYIVYFGVLMPTLYMGYLVAGVPLGEILAGLGLLVKLGIDFKFLK